MSSPVSTPRLSANGLGPGKERCILRTKCGTTDP